MNSQVFNQSNKARNIVLVLTMFSILAVINIDIAGKEKIIRNGINVLLRLAPRDPRSLLQGDYMALRYSIVGEVGREAKRLEMNDGFAVIELSELNEAKFVAIHQAQLLENGQHLLRYRKRGESVRLASDAYFFEEGSAELYAGARFGEVRINKTGDAVLIGLRDDRGERLGPALH